MPRGRVTRAQIEQIHLDMKKYPGSRIPERPSRGYCGDYHMKFPEETKGVVVSLGQNLETALQANGVDGQTTRFTPKRGGEYGSFKATVAEVKHDNKILRIEQDTERCYKGMMMVSLITDNEGTQERVSRFMFNRERPSDHSTWVVGWITNPPKADFPESFDAMNEEFMAFANDATIILEAQTKAYVAADVGRIALQ